MNWSFKFILDVYVPPLLILLSFVTNVLVIQIYKRNKFKKINARNFWRLLSLIDIICSLQILKHFTRSAFNYDIMLISALSCKVFVFLSHTGAVSAWLHVYISMERFCSIVSPHVSKLLQTKSAQTRICFSIFAFNIVFYSQHFIYTDIITTNKSIDNLTYSSCNAKALYKEAVYVFNWLDLLISTVVPFVIMFFCSIVLICSIWRTRKRVYLNQSPQAKRRLKRDMRFSVNTVLLDFMFIALNLPISVHILIDGDLGFVFSITDDLYYLSYTVNFLIFFAVNSLFRHELLNSLPFLNNRRT